ncbi:MAG: ornithine cyclodeaminase family protein [Myxococcota bacterium]
MSQPVFIRESLVEKHVTAADVVRHVEDAERARGHGNAWNEPRRRVKVPGGVLHLMGAAWPERGLLGYKAYTSFKDAVRFHVHGFDVKTGAPVAVAEAGRLGQLRTGAATAVAVKHLANPAPDGGSVVALLGTGYVAWGQLECVLAVRAIKELRVFSRTAQKRDDFVQRARTQLGVNAVVSESAQTAVKSADVVITATTSAQPVLEGAWLTEGTTVCAVGANALVRREIDGQVLARAAAVVVDSVDQARLESGALMHAVESGRFHWEQALELGGVAAGKTGARKARSDVVVFLSHGLALWDIASLAAALEKVPQDGLPRAYPA